MDVKNGISITLQNVELFYFSETQLFVNKSITHNFDEVPLSLKALPNLSLIQLKNHHIQSLPSTFLLLWLNWNETSLLNEQRLVWDRQGVAEKFGSAQRD